MSAEDRAPGCRETDLVGSRLGSLVWGLSGALFLIGVAWGDARSWLWTPALLVAGIACLANAYRCGRLHCFMTGPVFLLAAGALLLDVADIVSVDWRWILVFVIAGTVSGYGLESTRGKYVLRRM